MNVAEREYVWAGDRLLTATEDVAGDPLRRVVHVDRLGSVVLETRSVNGHLNADGEAAYDPYGRRLLAAAFGDDPLHVPYGYARARFDDATAPDRDLGLGRVETLGLYLMGARWYDPELGRFLEQDPIGETGGLNLYAYVGSSPTMWVDPTGLADKPSKPCLRR